MTDPQDPKPPRLRPAPKRNHPHRTTLRWNNTDYARLVEDAERAGLTVSSYIRSCALRSPTTQERRRETVEFVALGNAVKAVNRMGGNLHQLARHLNFGGIPYPEEMVAALRAYDAMVFGLLAAIERQR